MALRKKGQIKTRKTKHIKRRAFQLSVKFFVLGFYPTKSLFNNLAPKARTKTTLTKRGFSTPKKQNQQTVTKHGHETAIFGQNAQNQKFQLSFFFFCFSFLWTTKGHTKHCWNPYFYSVLAKSKKILLPKQTKTGKFEKKQFWDRTQNYNWVCKNRWKHRLKRTWPR